MDVVEEEDTLTGEGENMGDRGKAEIRVSF